MEYFFFVELSYWYIKKNDSYPFDPVFHYRFLCHFRLGHFTPAKAQETGTLSVTTTPVSGAIYIYFVFKGTKFWSGDLRVLYSL